MPLTETFNQDSSGNITTTGTGIAGTPAAGVQTVQGVTGMTPLSIIQQASSTAILTSVASSATSVTLLAANANRKGFILYNNSSKTCNVAFATTASLAAFTVAIPAMSVFESESLYTGVISGIWTAANGSMEVTELT
jgi:hypothetical protein